MENIDYVAGLLDAQMAITVCKRGGKDNVLKVTLANADERVGPVVRKVFPPTREVMVKTPKKTTCTLMYYDIDARKVLEFAKEQCKLVAPLATKGLAHLDAPDSWAPEEPLCDVPEDVCQQWAAGYFDVKGVVFDKPRAAISAPKVCSEDSAPKVLQAISKTLGGKVKKNRIVFDSKASLRGLLDACGEYVQAKTLDFDRVRGMI